MAISDGDIRALMAEGRIVIDPLFPSAIQAATVDLHLDGPFLTFKKDCKRIDPRFPLDDQMEEHELSEDKQFILPPGGFALAMTYEFIAVDRTLLGRLDGKSSVGRMGVAVHVTAGILDPGNGLRMTLELANLSPCEIVLYHKMPIAQIEFELLSSPAQNPYGTHGFNSKYCGSTRPVPSQYYKNFQSNNEWIKFKR